MIGQNNPGVDTKKLADAKPPDGFSQILDFTHQQIVSMSLQQVHRKKTRFNRGRRYVDSWAWLGFFTCRGYLIRNMRPITMC